MAGTNPERMIIINFERSLGIAKEIIIRISGGSDRGCSLYGGDVVAPSAPDLEELWN